MIQMDLQHTKPRTQTERMKTAGKAFASAVLLTATIFGCDAEPYKAMAAPLPPARPAVKNKSLEVKCTPCPDCTVPEDASLLRQGAIIGTAKYVPNVLVLRGIDRSTVEARYEQVTANIPHAEKETFSIKPTELCTVSVSGKEIYDVHKPGAFLVEPGWVYLSSKRARLYVPVQK